MSQFAQSPSKTVPFAPNNNPLRRLSQLAIQIQAGAQDLIGYELFFGEENIGYVHTGANSMLDSVHNLMRSAVESETGNPLLSQDARHDLRNQVAIVKGFADLMKMDLPTNHPARTMLDRLTERSTDFVEILDQIKITACDELDEPLPMAG